MCGYDGVDWRLGFFCSALLNFKNGDFIGICCGDEKHGGLCLAFIFFFFFFFFFLGGFVIF
jgi:hypothetical protein